jgi:site-specific DNA recombinase
MRQFALNGSAQIVKKLLLDNYKKFVNNPFDEKKQIAQEIDKLNARLSVARNKLLSEIIDDEEYLEIKDECRKRIESLEEQLSKDSSDANKINIEQSLDKALDYIQNIPKLYSEGEIHTRRAVIGSIFPEKMEFDGKTYRTTRMNVIAHHIFQINSGLPLKKNRTNESEFHLSCLVAHSGIEPLFIA